jgi:mono/diheme cytochrome c family protein
MSPRRPRASRWLLALLGVASSAVAAEQIDFNRQIRPILADACFHCHGPDAASREAKLRLDEREGFLQVREGVAVVVPGKPDESELLHRIVSPHEDEVMPPPRAARQLMPEEKELLRRWVVAGAPWGRHWSFAPPVATAVDDIRLVFRSETPSQTMPLTKIEPMITGKRLRC